MNKPSWIACVGAAGVMLGCGGGGGASGAADAAAPAQTQVEYVPVAASRDTASFAGWLKQMSTEAMEGKDSMDTSTFTPALQDNADPVAAPL